MGGFSNIKSKLLAEQVQEQIYHYILETPLEPGSKLPNEFELGEKFDVGRSTIREAVKLLVSQGILEVRRGSGTYVVNTTPSDLDPLGLSGAEDKMALALDLVNVRLILEPGIAEMAALNATEEAILELRCCCERVEERIASGDMYIQDDIAFHTSVARCSGNKVVEQLIPIIDTAVMMFVNVTHQRLTKETVMTHRAIVDAISDRDPIGAKTAMMMHMTYNRNMILKLIREEKEKDHKE